MILAVPTPLAMPLNRVSIKWLRLHLSAVSGLTVAKKVQKDHKLSKLARIHTNCALCTCINKCNQLFLVDFDIDVQSCDLLSRQWLHKLSKDPTYPCK